MQFGLLLDSLLEVDVAEPWCRNVKIKAYELFGKNFEYNLQGVQVCKAEKFHARFMEL